MSGRTLSVAEGTVLDGRYRLQELIGSGGTADVYRGTDELLGRSVAVKVFNSQVTDLNTAERQRTEMRALASLNHPNLVAVHDARVAAAHARHEQVDPTDGIQGGAEAAPPSTYLVMELVEGVTLAELLVLGPLPADLIKRLGVALASALELVHARGLVHRDVKPANILLADSGSIKLGDFGLARVLSAEERITTGADVMGTAAYFSPEQARGIHAESPCDIYALGLVLLECFTGRREFPGPAVQAAVARLLRDPVIPTELPTPWPTLLRSMTQTQPESRPTAGEVLAIIDPDRTPAHVLAPTRQPADGVLSVDVAPASADTPELPTVSAATASAANQPTDGWSGPLSQFLRQAPAPSRPRRRQALLLGGGALAAAVTTTALFLLPPTSADPAVRSPEAATTATSTAGRAPSAAGSTLVKPTAKSAPAARRSSAGASGVARPLARSSQPAPATRSSQPAPATRSSQPPPASPAASPPTKQAVQAALVARSTAAATHTPSTKASIAKAAPKAAKATSGKQKDGGKGKAAKPSHPKKKPKK